MTIRSTSESQKLSEEKKEIDKLLGKQFKNGDRWYLIERRWYEHYAKYAENPTASNFPGPIDNSLLLRDQSTDVLADNLCEKTHFVFVPEEAYIKLRDRFGLRQPTDEICRNVIETDLAKWVKEEANLQDDANLNFSIVHINEEVEAITFSKETLEDLNFHVGQRFLVTVDGDRRQKQSFTSDKPHSVPPVKEIAPLAMAHVITANAEHPLLTGKGLLSLLCEKFAYFLHRYYYKYCSLPYLNVKNIFRSSPPMLSSHALTASVSGNNLLSKSTGLFGASSSIYEANQMLGTSASTENFNKKFPPLGLSGLVNLGNTCFMNSALQCMSNTPPLSEYFVTGQYEQEINETNPLGMRGEMARAFGDLMKQMWSTKNSSVNPRNFKSVVGRFSPQFSGYQQQDSQELLAFLLDGLHEDLNRVRKKPYIEAKDYDGIIIVDLFHGLLKSTLVCPVCSKRSVTFDPFCYLSLPLAVKQDRQIMVVFVPLDISERIMQYQITVLKNGLARDLIESLSRMTKKNPAQIVLTEVTHCRISKFFNREDDLNTVIDRGILVAYETVQVPPDANPIELCVYNRINRKSVSILSGTVGLPLLLLLKREDLEYTRLRSILVMVMSRFVPGLQEENEEYMDDENDSGVDDNENGDSNQDESNHSQKMEVSVGEKTTGSSPANSEKFRIILTNAYGNSSIQPLSPSQPHLTVPTEDHVYVCLEWKSSLEKYFVKEPEFEKHNSCFKNRAARKNVQLSECLDLFTTTERLGKHDLWFCPQCKKHQQATKKFDIWSVPEILIIHLKRFSYNMYYRNKIETLVDFPLQKLNLNQWVMNENSIEEVNYDLIAVSNHYGGLGGGHYTACAKNRIDKSWYIFDDSRVSKVDDSEVLSPAAYVLVYSKRHESETKMCDPNFEIEDCE
uniref:Ubiquitin carboxyl-terminal hydrolase n=1 Tax=Romanomermis culicivorax TaxID=13658 RepID=A0A915I6V7_ROMCU